MKQTEFYIIAPFIQIKTKLKHIDKERLYSST